MFPNYNHKFGVGCATCKHVWFLLTNDDKVSKELQVQWVKELLLDHYNIHKEKGYKQGFQI